ncbi:MAG: chromate transporter, partial [Bacillota bacterium]
VALSQVTPGPVAVNAATYVGYQYAGLGGAAVASIGVVLPSFLLILIVMHFLKKFQESRSLGSVLGGIRPATVGMIASAVIFLAENSIFNGALLSAEIITNTKDYINLLPCIIFVGTIILAGKFNVGPIKLTLLAGIIGALIIR